MTPGKADEYQLLPALKRIFLPNKDAENRGKWVVYQVGHGFYSQAGDSGVVAGMSVDNLREEIKFFDEKLNVATFFQLTCYGGGINSMLPFIQEEKNAFQQKTFIRNHFPIYITGTPGFEVSFGGMGVYYFLLFELGWSEEVITEKIKELGYDKLSIVFKRTPEGHLIPIGTHKFFVDILTSARMKSGQEAVTIKPLDPSDLPFDLRGDFARWKSEKKLVLIMPSAMQVPVVVKEPRFVFFLSGAPGSFLHVGKELDLSQPEDRADYLSSPQAVNPIICFDNMFFEIPSQLGIESKKTYLFKTVKFLCSQTPPYLVQYLGYKNDFVLELNNVMISVTKKQLSIYFEVNDPRDPDVYYIMRTFIPAFGKTPVVPEPGASFLASPPVVDQLIFLPDPSRHSRRASLINSFLKKELPNFLQPSRHIGYLEDYKEGVGIARMPGQEDLKPIVLTPSRITNVSNWPKDFSGWDYIWFMTGCFDDAIRGKLASFASRTLGISAGEKITNMDIRFALEKIAP